MKKTAVVKIDAQAVISGKVDFLAVVRECELRKTGLMVKNTILFFDDEKPTNAEIFDELLEACDSAGVDVFVEGMDETELLPDDFMKAMARLSFELYGFKKDPHGIYSINH